MFLLNSLLLLMHPVWKLCSKITEMLMCSSELFSKLQRGEGIQIFLSSISSWLAIGLAKYFVPRHSRLLMGSFSIHCRETVGAKL